MATNKRKDAAALFELIEKSTLKVPKTASGALKIPGWWSSKTNPPVKGSSAARTPFSSPAQAATPPAASPVAALPETAVPATPAESPAPPDMPTTPDSSLERPPVLPAKAPVYLPQTVSHDRTAGRPTLVPGTPVPLWAGLLAALVVVGIITAAIAVMLRQRHGAPEVGGNLVGTPLGTPAMHPPSITPFDPARAGEVTPAPTVGHVLATQVVRDPNLYYLVVACYPRQDMAQKAAEFLAAHGVDVCVEPARNYYWLISAKGFSKVSGTDAKAFYHDVIEIGRKHPDAAKKKISIFNSAYYSRIARGT